MVPPRWLKRLLLGSGLDLAGASVRCKRSRVLGLLVGRGIVPGEVGILVVPLVG